MLTKEHTGTLRVIAQSYLNDEVPTEARAMLTDIASIIETTVSLEASDDAKRQALQDIGHGCASALSDMVASLECDYDRLKELDTPELNGDINSLIESDDATELVELREAAGDCESRDDAEQRIQEDPLSIEVRTGWFSPGDCRDAAIEEFCILLGTGGPATRVRGELGDNNEPIKAWIEAQDWGTPWTEYRGDAISDDDLLTYCRCFYFGEG